MLKFFAVLLSFNRSWISCKNDICKH